MKFNSSSTFLFLIGIVFYIVIITGCNNDATVSDKNLTEVKIDSSNITPNENNIPSETTEELDEYTYNIGEGYFLKGQIGEIPIEVYLNSNQVNNDTTFLKGQYWYTSLYKPLDIEGFYLPKQGKLWFHRANKEFFDLNGFQGSSAKGDWTMGEKKMACQLESVQISDFDFVKDIQPLLKEFEYVKINLDKQAIKLDMNLEPSADGMSLDVFNNWALSFVVAEDAGSQLATYTWQLLKAPTPTVLYLENESSPGREVFEDDNGETMSAYIDLNDLWTASLYVFENNTWVKKSLKDLKEDINETLSNYHDSQLAPKTSPTSIFVDKERWIWDGKGFVKK